MHRVSGKVAIANLLCLIEPNQDLINPDYLYYILDFKKKEMAKLMTGSANVSMKVSDLESFIIPVPSIQAQCELVEEVSRYQKIVNGAEQVVNNYQPSFLIKDDWELKKLSEIASVEMGQSPPGDSYNETGDGIPLINGPVEFGPTSFSKTKRTKFTTKPTKICEVDDLILCVRGSTTGRMNIAGYKSCIGRGVAAIRSEKYQRWLIYYFNSIQNKIYDLGNGSTFPNITSKTLAELQVPIPPENEIDGIINTIESELRIIDLNRELVRSFMEKTLDRINEIWGK